MRYIDADALDFGKCRGGMVGGVMFADLNDIVRVIKAAPTADVAPVVRGKLVSTGYDEAYWEFGDCTICGADNPMQNKFCGHCGALMEGGQG